MSKRDRRAAFMQRGYNITRLEDKRHVKRRRRRGSGTNETDNYIENAASTPSISSTGQGADGNLYVGLEPSESSALRLHNQQENRTRVKAQRVIDRNWNSDQAANDMINNTGSTTLTNPGIFEMIAGAITDVVETMVEDDIDERAEIELVLANTYAKRWNEIIFGEAVSPEEAAHILPTQTLLIGGSAYSLMLGSIRSDSASGSWEGRSLNVQDIQLNLSFVYSALQTSGSPIGDARIIVGQWTRGGSPNNNPGALWQQTSLPGEPVDLNPIRGPLIEAMDNFRVLYNGYFSLSTTRTVQDFKIFIPGDRVCNIDLDNSLDTTDEYTPTSGDIWFTVVGTTNVFQMTGATKITYNVDAIKKSERC